MGTLLEQPKRDYKGISNSDIEAFIQDSQNLASKYKISVIDVISATKVLELQRKNDLYVSNGDIHDEQMAGLGELLQQLITALEK